MLSASGIELVEIVFALSLAAGAEIAWAFGRPPVVPHAQCPQHSPSVVDTDSLARLLARSSPD